MLAQKLLASKENEIEMLKNQIAMQRKYCEKYETKNKNQKLKLNSKKEVISTLRVEYKFKNAEITELKVQLA